MYRFIIIIICNFFKDLFVILMNILFLFMEVLSLKLIFVHCKIQKN